jgi:hypothetical protein
LVYLFALFASPLLVTADFMAPVYTIPFFFLNGLVQETAGVFVYVYVFKLVVS